MEGKGAGDEREAGERWVEEEERLFRAKALEGE
jgi:hypothetical protein